MISIFSNAVAPGETAGLLWRADVTDATGQMATILGRVPTRRAAQQFPAGWITGGAEAYVTRCRFRAGNLILWLGARPNDTGSDAGPHFVAGRLADLGLAVRLDDASTHGWSLADAKGDVTDPYSWTLPTLTAAQVAAILASDTVRLVMVDRTDPNLNWPAGQFAYVSPAAKAAAEAATRAAAEAEAAAAVLVAFRAVERAAGAGMDAMTGRAIARDPHLRQSIGMLFSTPAGTRTGRLEYGFDLLGAVDAPASDERLAAVYAAAAAALDAWEPRLDVTRIELLERTDDGARIRVEGVRTDGGAAFADELVLSRRSFGAGLGA